MMSVAAKFAEELNIHVMNDLSHPNRYAKLNEQCEVALFILLLSPRGSGILPILQIL